MKGDFSKWRFESNKNFNGVLHQQGRVLLDSDWNEQTQATLNWQDQTARDTIGPGVAAVPAHEGSNFKVQSASFNTDRVELTITPGRIWADGISVYLPGEESDVIPNVTRTATYLPPPFQDIDIDVTSIEGGVRDAVILEVWREEINGFQLPESLIEPALGGPDTTERVHTAFAFRLLRLEPGENCNTIRNRLRDDISLKGTLRVTLQLPDEISGDCPVVEGGGYTGFEHHLYRFEIAEVNGGIPMFKWSQFNGGLVGRGTFSTSTSPNKVSITANLQPILTSGLSEFYLEALALDPNLRHWIVTYGAKVTLNNEGELNLPDSPIFGAVPDGSVFFRLWNGILPISDFPVGLAEPNELRNGIRLEFAAATEVNYSPRDYWTFKVRAGEISNQAELIKSMPPEGVRYHRVPLAELNWNSDGPMTLYDGQIEDCRKMFPPLTDRKGCCTFHVGDGVQSFGDFISIEEALRHLPERGGEICLMPGIHETNARIVKKEKIKIKGCYRNTLVISRSGERNDPIFHIIDSNNILLEHMDLVCFNGAAILLEGVESNLLRGIEIRYNRIMSGVHAIFVQHGSRINVHHNLIRMLDHLEGADVAIYMMAEDSLIERNRIVAISAETVPPPNNGVPYDPKQVPTHPCVDIKAIYKNKLFLTRYVDFIWNVDFRFPVAAPFQVLGGIQLAGGCERVVVLDNEITGGAGNGITLGRVLPYFSQEDPEENEEGDKISLFINNEGDVIFQVKDESGIFRLSLTFKISANNYGEIEIPSNEGFFTLPDVIPDDYFFSIQSPTNYIIESIVENAEPRENHKYVINVKKVLEEIHPNKALAFLYEINIKGNLISKMGLSGIGTLDSSRFTDTTTINQLGNPIEGLTIRENHIFHCWQNSLNNELREVIKMYGIGGISLETCVGVAILENRIENNGTDHLKPTCGIYISHGEDVNISHNRIVNNGPLAGNLRMIMEEGSRGGIVITVSTSRQEMPTTELIFTHRTHLPIGLPQNAISYAAGRPAACIHHNIVDQPAGPALKLEAIGPLSILGNKFFSQLADPNSSYLAGGVQIVNEGGYHRIDVDKAINALSNINLSMPSRYITTSPRHFPSGNTLFNDNQTYVGPNNGNNISQYLLVFDDLGFDGNQSYNDKTGELLANTFLLATTLRASNNRFKEMPNSTDLSLLSYSILLNNTTNNQGDHCIIALSQASSPTPTVVDSGNQILVSDEFCKGII